MWVPSIQGFTEPQDVQSRDHRQHLEGQRGAIGTPGVSNSHLPQLSSILQTATAAPKKQQWPSAHLSGRKELLNLFFSLQREHKSFGQRSDKGKRGLEHLEATKIFYFSWFAQLRAMPASKFGLCSSSLWAQSDTGGNESLSQSFKKKVML